MNNHWQLDEPLAAISFDCDCTLSQIEGINELAKQNRVYAAVAKLTEQAMSQTGIAPALYAERLDLVKPHYQQVVDLAELYYQTVTPGLLAIIEVFQFLKKELFVFSAGVNPAVKLFAKKLAISEEHTYAVDLYFDKQGHYQKYATDSLMTQMIGKQTLVQQLSQQFPRFLHIGDGMNDICLKDDVVRFVGYGGASYRESIERASSYYIKTKSMLPLLPLALTAIEVTQLTDKHKEIYQQGLEMMGDVVMS